MIKIATKLVKNEVQVTVDGKLKSLSGNFAIKYPVDICDVPISVVNFMVGMLLSEQLSWSEGTFEFSEMSDKQLDSLNRHIRINARLNPYGHAANKPANVLVERKSQTQPPDDSGLVLLGNGMGKDGLAVLSLLSETGLAFRSFTVGSFYKNEELWEERLANLGRLAKEKGIDYDIINSELLKKLKFRVMPWWLYGLPLAYALRSKTILQGFEISFSRTHSHLKLPPRPNASYFSQRDISEATGVTFSSPLQSLTQYGIQRLLLERYPDNLKYQRSCMRGTPACRSDVCPKCAMHSLYAQAAGHDPELLSLPRITSKKYVKVHPFDEDNIINAVRKINKKPYSIWFAQASRKAMDLCWRSDLFEPIIAQHYEFYDTDPGLGDDNLPYEYLPSKWDDIYNNIWIKS